MATHFNAFISYRHSPLDSQVAQRIHRQLERFRIPKAIQKVTGIKKIDRIFRDKEELPLSINLSDDINEALVNSDYLIVICSPRFQQSQWCMREIDLFLQTHPVERILIVLAEGEPDDVVPPILTQNREPLCCDYRMKPHKAKSIELPRLVSAILGCRYDELRQRQRQYRMRRTIAAISAALVASLCLTAYFIHTSIQIQKANDDLHAANVQIQEANVQIQANLDEALRNQSQYLASSATERMEAGDRLTAISLALEALPSEDNQRPYVAEAEFALSNALSAYQQEDTLSAIGSFRTEGLVRQFLVSEDGMTIYILDARHVVTVWDTVTFQKLETIDVSDHSVQKMYLTKGENLIFTPLHADGELLCYAKDGQLLWSVSQCRDQAFLDDRSVLMVLQSDYTQSDRILYLDPETGVESAPALELSALPEDQIPVGFFQEDYVSTLPVTLDYFSGSIHYFYSLWPQTGEMTVVLESDTSFTGLLQFVDCVQVIPNGDILVMRGDGSGMSNGTYQNFEVTSADRADIFCFDGKTLRQKWQTKITTYIYTSTSTITPIPDSRWLLCQNGNTFLICDSLTGEILKEYQTPAVPLDMTVESDSTWGLLENGMYFSFDYADDSCYAMSFMEDTIDMAEAKRGYFVHSPLGSQVTVYRSVKDDGGTELDGEFGYATQARQTWGPYLMAFQSNKLYMMNMQTRKLLWQKDLGSGWEVLGFSPDGEEFWMWNYYDDYACAFRTQSAESRELPFDMGDFTHYPESNVFMAGQQLLVLMESDGKTWLQRMDLQSGKELPALEIPALAQEKMDFYENTQFLLADDAHAWIWRSKETLHVIDLRNGQLTDVLSGITVRPQITRSKDGGALLICQGNEVLQLNMNGTVVERIHLGQKKGVSACFYQDQYLVLCDDGDVYRYDSQGKQQSQTTLHLYNTFYSNASNPDDDPMSLHWWVTDDGDVILNAFKAGNIIDCDQWQVRAFVPNLFACSEDGDALICLCNQKMYAYSRYTTAQQMAKAQQTLGDFQMTEEDRKAYGLS